MPSAEYRKTCSVACQLEHTSRGHNKESYIYARGGHRKVTLGGLLGGDEFPIQYWQDIVADNYMQGTVITALTVCSVNGSIVVNFELRWR